MFDKKTDYALNKNDPNAIVYKDADDKLIRLTREDFDTERDFLLWKKWSDANYHEVEKENHAYANHTQSLEQTEEYSVSTPSVEVLVQRRFEREEQTKINAEMVIRIRGELTDKQFRRLWMYCVEQLTEAEIAAAENVKQQSVSESITAARKKVQKLPSPKRPEYLSL